MAGICGYVVTWPKLTCGIIGKESTSKNYVTYRFLTINHITEYTVVKYLFNRKV